MTTETELTFFETTGFSMWPFIRAGEKLIIKKTPIKDLKLGDIILFTDGKAKVCHRLIKKIRCNGKYILYTRGDNLKRSTDPVTEEMYIGKAIVRIKANNKIVAIGKIQQFFNRLMVPAAPLICRCILKSKSARDRLFR